jgi:hypothetical protein
MDGAAFDRLTRSFRVRPSRRGLLAGLSGGLTALLPLLRDPASPARSKKRKKGKRKKKEISCAGKTDGTRCGSGKECSGGKCARRPSCTPIHEEPPNFVECDKCCAGVCISGSPDCGLGGIGDRCHSNDDCFASDCIGFVCTPRFCPAGFDACKSPAGCGSFGGQCFQPIGGGPTRCGESAGTCGCTSHQQCVTNHGQGAFCVRITGGRCDCGTEDLITFCAVPR